MLSFDRIKLSSFALSLIVIGYIFLLNLFVNKINMLHYAIGGALALLFVMLLFEKAPKSIFKVILSFFVLLASVTIYFKYNFKVVITESIILSIFVNNAAVNFEMLGKSFYIWVFMTAIVPIFFIFKVNITSKISLTKLIAVETSILLLLALWLYLIGFQWHKKGEIRDPKIALSISYFSPVDTLFAMQRGWRYYKKMKKQYANIVKLTDLYKYKSEEENLTVVMIIGESTRGDHFQINGYERETTPKLMEEAGLISFSHVTSCDTITVRSLPCMISPLMMEEKRRIPKKGSFVDIFRKLGFYTTIYSLQGLNDIYNYMGYDELLTKYAILKNSKYSTQDAALLPYVKHAIADKTHQNKLIILHTLGSHNRYVDRLLPKQFKFKPNCENSNLKKCTKEEIFNSYDNTIVAIDEFISDIIALLKDKKALLIYTSDHGESLGENGIYTHGSPLANAPKEQRDVPLIFWFSNAYRTSKEGALLYKSLLAAKKSSRPVSHNELFYSILGCSGIVSDNNGTNEHFDLCSKAFLVNSGDLKE